MNFLPPGEARHQALAPAPQWTDGRTGGIDSDSGQRRLESTSQELATDRQRTWRVAKSVLAVAIVVIVGWFPVQRFLEVSSTEAVVNARLVTVRSPIDGEVAPSMV